MFKSVLQIFVKKIEPDYQNIWLPGKRSKSSGSGFGVEIKNKKYVITNSHVVRFSHFIECVKHNSEQRFQLNLFDIANELDLALLEPVDNEFWVDIPIMKIQDPPPKGSEILVVGFPQGGTNPSITKGIISRIIPILYSKSILNLALQVDSAINPGNSGGPVFNNNSEIIGVAFSHNTKGQNICYVIPSFLLQHYLQSIEKFGKYPGICDLEIECSNLENKNAMQYYGASNGLLINRVNPIGNLADLLREHDILLSIDSIKINGDHTYFAEHGERFPYWHLIRMKFPNDLVQLKIMRQKKEKTIHFRIAAMQQVLIPSLNIDLSYYIAGGLILVPLNYWYIFSPTNIESKVELNKFNLVKYVQEFPPTIGHQIIILVDILPNVQNSGYSMENQRLLKIEDEEINNIYDVYRILENKDSEFIKFEFDMGKIIILSQESLSLSENISQAYLKTPHTNINVKTSSS